MSILIMLIILGLFIWLIGYIAYKTILWVLKPLAEQPPEEELIEPMSEEDLAPECPNAAEIIKALAHKKDKMIYTIFRCPKCKKISTYYDPKIKRVRCTNCEWINNIDSEMTFEEFCKYYGTAIDKSEFSPNKQ